MRSHDSIYLVTINCAPIQRVPEEVTELVSKNALLLRSTPLMSQRMFGVGRPLVAVHVRLTVLPALGSALHVITADVGKSERTWSKHVTQYSYTSGRTQ